MSSFISIILLLALVEFLPTNVTSLQVVTTNTKLPKPSSYIPTVYDGDAIYLLGGGNRATAILKYNVESETIAVIGNMTILGDGTSTLSETGDIYYFGGFTSGGMFSSEIRRIGGDGSTTIVGRLPQSVRFAAAAWDGEQYIYTAGGSIGPIDYNTIVRYSTRTSLSETVGQLPRTRGAATAAWDSNTNSLFVFGGQTYNSGNGPIYFDDVLNFDPVTGITTKLNATLPIPSHLSCAVWTGQEAYIIGGIGKNYYEYPQLVRFTQSTGQVESVAVDDFPERLYGAGCAYVKKLNRIYIFGGSAIGGYTDDIRYIDL